MPDPILVTLVLLVVLFAWFVYTVKGVPIPDDFTADQADTHAETLTHDDDETEADQ